MEQEVKIPVMAHYKCPTCGASAVAETGGQLLCQQCVNQFLARNVGMMEEQVAPTREHLDALPVEGGGTG